MASSHAKVSVTLLVTLVTVGAASTIAATLPTTADVVRDRPATVAGIVALTLALQLLTLRLPAKGSIGFASLGLVLAGIALGAGPAMAVGALAGLVHWIRTRGLFHRAMFDAGNMALGAGAAAVTYDLVHGLASSAPAEFVAAAAASSVYVTINFALLCVAMSLSESRSPRLVWLERFHWARYYLLGFGPVAGTLTIGDEPLQMGLVISLTFSLALLLRMRHHLRSASLPVRPARAQATSA